MCRMCLCLHACLCPYSECVHVHVSIRICMRACTYACEHIIGGLSGQLDRATVPGGVTANERLHGAHHSVVCWDKARGLA